MKSSRNNPLTPEFSFQEKLIALLLLTIPVLIAYWPVLSYDFVNWDDPYYVYKNDTIAKLNGKTIRTLFSTDTIVMGNWHPFTMISLAIDRAIWGLNPMGYHLTNLILHLLNSILAAFLAWKLFSHKWAALFTGMAFGLHPLHIESVAWITERKDVLYTAFFFGSWITWIYSGNKKVYYILSLILFSAACLSKAMAVTLPVLLLLSESLQTKNARIKETIPYFILAIIFGLLGISAQQSAQALTYHSGFSIWDNACIAGYNVWFYLAKIFLPWPLSAFYPYPEKIEGNLPLAFIIGFIASALVVILSTILLIKKKFKLAFFPFVFFVSIFPVIQFIPLGEAMAADRYTYFSSWPIFLGIFLLLFQQLPKSNGMQYGSMAILGMLCLTCLVLVRKRLPVWQSGVLLWENVIEQYPNVYFAWNNLGTLYYEKQEFDKAIPVYQKVLEMNPDYKDGHNNLGSIFATRKSYDSAIVHFERAVELDSNYIAAVFNLGYAYGLTGKTQEGLPLLQKAARNGHTHAQQILTQNKLSW